MVFQLTLSSNGTETTAANHYRELILSSNGTETTVANHYRELTLSSTAKPTANHWFESWPFSMAAQPETSNGTDTRKAHLLCEICCIHTQHILFVVDKILRQHSHKTVIH
jgi:hypothetical protein